MNLVTGATGHIGNVLIRRLLEQGRKVRALIWRGEDTTPLRGLEIEMIEGDVLDPDSLGPALHGVDKVFHLAGLISIMPGASSLLQRINVEGTRNMLSAALQAGVRRFIYTSSIHALPEGTPDTVIDETSGFHPSEAPAGYGRSKAEASLEVQEACRQGLDAVIVCPTGVIGPFDFRRSEMGSVILDAAMGRTMPYVDGNYDFADVRDVAEGLILAGEAGRTGESYILSGDRLSVRYILESVRQATGKAFTLIRIPLRLAAFVARFTPYYYLWTHTRPRFTSYSLEVLRSNSHVSHAKATRELGYHPRPLHQTIGDTAHWFLENLFLFYGPART